MSIGQRIREVRTIRGLTQTAVAREIGISQPQYARLETDDSNPRANTLKAICIALDCSPDFILELIDQPQQLVTDPNPTVDDLPKRIKEAHLSTSIDLTDFATKVGVTASTTSAWETGRSLPTSKNLKAIALVASVSVTHLLGLDEPGPATETVEKPNASTFDEQKIISLIRALTDDDRQFVINLVKRLASG